MGCSCNERRQASVRIVKSAVQADVEAIGKELTFIAKTVVEDTTNVFRQSVAAARTRLMRKR